MAVQELNDNTFKDAVGQEDKMIIKFYADWCGSCRLISPKFKRLSEDERFKGVHFFEVDAEKNPEARKWAGVKDLPFFVTIQSGEVKAADTMAKEDKIVELLNNVSNQ